MDKDEILNVLKESEIDALVAQNIFGLAIVKLEDASCPYCGDEMRFCGSRSWCAICSEWRYSPYKEYTNDISAAWEVVEKLKELKPIINYDPASKKWYMRFNGGEFQSAETAPLAILRAALLITL